MTKSLPVSSQWIVSPRYDLIFFIFPMIFSILPPLLYFGILQTGTIESENLALTIFFIYLFTLNLPHVFYTFIRTNFDKEEYFRKQKFYLYGPFFILCMALVIFLFDNKNLFLMVYPILGLYHAMRQDWGFLKLYKLKNFESGKGIDYIFFTSTRFLLIIALQLPLILNYFNFNHSLQTENLLRYSFYISLLFYIYYCYVNFSRSRPINITKILFISVNLFGYMAMFHFVSHFNLPILILLASVGIYHDVQYHAWIQHYGKSRFLREDYKRFKVCIKYVFLISLFFASYFIFFHQFRLTNLIHSFLLVYHYYVDGKIWRFSKAKELRTTYA
ncbi:MAG: hypothetical protein OEY33_04505 [Bdellovibrionales bacterium]|jgi:hypothetical protein|nr:hypothetical protein [Bdellovibrionales bacterium]